jgi:hypothetical protein
MSSQKIYSLTSATNIIDMKKLHFAKKYAPALIVFFFLSGLSQLSGQILKRNFVDVNLRVVSPISDPYPIATGYIITADDKIAMTVNFNWPVKTETVIVGTTLFLTFPKTGSTKAVLLAWSNDNKTLTITTQQTRGELLSHTPDAFFSIKLLGNKPSVIRLSNVPAPTAIQAVNGHFLDGDNDDKDGGDCVIRFVSVG